MDKEKVIPAAPAMTAKDLATDQDVRWCPGCGDYSILKQVQTVLPELGLKREDIVFISGIGCSSRFPYYMNTFGMHSIHGRATAIASGLKAVRPELSVWIVTGDGDALSIGAGHTLHLLRRNFDVNLLLFNNEIYGLTKGQYSPTSPRESVTKSTPVGSPDHPFNPLTLALGADATFVARGMDRDPKHLQEMLRRSYRHKGSSFLEIYQNCNIFNDGAFFAYTEKDSRKLNALYLEHGKPLVFGDNNDKGIALDGHRPKVVSLANTSVNDILVHDEQDLFKAQLLARFFDDPAKPDALPRPFGVLLDVQRPAYEELMSAQLQNAAAQQGPGDLDALLKGKSVWEIK